MKEKVVRSKMDAAWKEALSVYFKAFMELCWPEVCNEIDWEKPFEVLEQEFQGMVNESNDRRVDKLIKVWRLNGEELCVLLHLEVQSWKEKEFSERLFVYYYYLYERYKMPIAMLAILIDNDFRWRPKCYFTETWGLSIKMEFPIIKLLDFKDKKEFLINSDNPFSIVLLAQLAALEASSRERTRLISKTQLTAHLITQGWKKEDILRLYKFLDWILSLKKEYAVAYHREVKRIEEEKQVSFITTAEYLGIKKGEKRGIIKGEKIGLEKGEKIGLEKGERIGIEKCLKEGQGILQDCLSDLLRSKFNALPENYQHEVEKASSDKMHEWWKKALICKNLEEVFEKSA